MKIKQKRFLSLLTISVILILTSLFTTSCFFDPDEAVNLKDSVSEKIIVGEESTVFHFYYASQEHPIEDYEIIKAEIDYYVDYHTSMKHKDFFFFVPDDIKYEEQTYFTAEIDDVLTNESVVYVSVHANFKTENNSRVWIYILAVVIALIVLIAFCAIYATMCDTFASNSAPSSWMWWGGIVIYAIIAFFVGSAWGTGPASIILSSAIFYFILTLFIYFAHRE